MNGLQLLFHDASLQDTPEKGDGLLSTSYYFGELDKCGEILICQRSTFRRLRRYKIALSTDPDSTLFLSDWTSVSS